MNSNSIKALDIMYNLSLSNLDFYEKVEKLKECYNIIADDLEKLERIKILLKKYDNNEIYFTRDFDFIDRVKEVVKK